MEAKQLELAWENRDRGGRVVRKGDNLKKMCDLLIIDDPIVEQTEEQLQKAAEYADCPNWYTTPIRDVSLISIINGDGREW